MTSNTEKTNTESDIPSSSDESQTQLDKPLPIFKERFGNATAPVTQYNSKGKKRAISRGKQALKDEVRAKAKKENVADTTNPNKYEVVFPAKKGPCKKKASAQEILAICDKPIRGRPKIIDVNSEQFHLLPDEIKVKQLELAKTEAEIQNLVRPIIMDSLPNYQLTTRQLNEIKGSVVAEVKAEHPKYNLKDILAAAALGYTSYRKYLKRIAKGPEEDIYAPVKQLILDIAKKNDYKFGRYRMTEELRKHNVYLCHLTVRKLMKELNVLVER